MDKCDPNKQGAGSRPKNGAKTLADHIFERVVPGLIFLLCSGVFGLVLSHQSDDHKQDIAINGLEHRVKGIELNRFTAADGVRLLNELKEWVNKNYPPASLTRTIEKLDNRIEQGLEKIDSRLRKLESQK